MRVGYGTLTISKRTTTQLIRLFSKGFSICYDYKQKVILNSIIKRYLKKVEAILYFFIIMKIIFKKEKHLSKRVMIYNAKICSGKKCESVNALTIGI